mgnify:CR=1 FL=1
MAIIKRGKSWQVSVSHQGNRVRKSFRNHDDARQYEAEALSALLSGKGVEPASGRTLLPHAPPMTFGGIAERVWVLEWSNQKSSRHTKKRLKNVCAYFGGHTLVTEIDSFRLEEYVVKLRSLGNAPATINRKLAIVSKIMGYAQRHSLISTKPHAPFQREPQGRIKYYSEEEELAILAAIKNRHLRDFYCVLLDTGMRKSEALGMEWMDIDFDKSEITLGDPEKIKTENPRSIPMSRRVCGILDGRLFDCRHDLNFRRPFHYTTDQVDVLLREFKSEAGYTGDLSAFFHTCRHTFCSRLLQRGVPITTVKELAGHRDIKTTLRYSHLSPSNHRDAIDKLEPDSIPAQSL